MKGKTKFSVGQLKMKKISNDIFWLKWKEGEDQLGFNRQELETLKSLVKKVIKYESK